LVRLGAGRSQVQILSPRYRESSAHALELLSAVIDQERESRTAPLGAVPEDLNRPPARPPGRRPSAHSRSTSRRPPPVTSPPRSRGHGSAPRDRAALASVRDDVSDANEEV